MNPDVPELQGANIKVMGSTCIDPATDEPWEAVNADPAISAHATNVVAMLVGNGMAGDGAPVRVASCPRPRSCFMALAHLVSHQALTVGEAIGTIVYSMIRQ